MLSEAAAWAQEVSGRLRILQTSFADDSAATRQEYLAEEIERSLKDVVDSRRAEYLDALAHRFPGPERIGAVPPSPAPAPIEPVKRTVEEVAEELFGRAAELTDEGKARLVERLRSLGLIGPPDRGIDLPPELRGKLGLNPDQVLDEERLSKLLAALLEMVATLDSLIWNLWKTIAPKSAVQRDPGDGFRRTIGRYLAGDREVATLQIKQMLEKTRQLLAGLLSAIGPTGESYARHHLQTFAPEKIRATVETGGFLTNVEQKCWRRYVTLAGELNGPAIEKQIVDAIVTYTEEVVSGRKRGGPEAARPPRP
jgi:hypothetical protein